MAAKRFTVREADALIPTLAPRVAELADALHAYRFAQEQLKELETVNAATASDPEHPDHFDLRRFTREARDHEKRAQAILKDFADLGVEMKDPYIGLLDFPCERTVGPATEVVYLCWRMGEERITHWHPVEGGFQARKPLDEL